MKILELRFKNLNSLYGEWCIDFTHPDYESNGLFAITGATGSGKTTILDALCLALYGQTPRLGKMTQSDNEVMSRQTGECFSEVLFETAKGTFRASWHQHRARKKAGMALQAPKRELADAEGTILAEKLKEVQEKIDDIMGMGFDRFTRSILLAQGSFDSFLKANADERSPLLEQITGTEIYTEISKAVHQRNSTENQTLNELKAGLGGIQLLESEVLEQIQFDLKQIQNKHKEIAQKRDSVKTALDGLLRIQTLDTDLQGARAALPELGENLELAEGVHKKHTEHLAQTEAEYKKLQPVLRQVREFDTQIAERQKTREKDAAALQKQRKELSALQKRKAVNKIKHKQLQPTQAKAVIYQKEHAQDAQLVGQLAAILQTLEQVKQRSAEKDSAEKAVKKVAKTAQLEKEKRVASEKKLAAVEAELSQIEHELETMLGGKLLPDWRTQRDALARRLELEKQIIKTRKTLASQLAQAEAAEKELSAKIKEQEGLQREQDLLQKNLQLQQKIESLEAERATLVDGQPCPLCGASEHPYATDLPAPPPDTLETVNTALRTLADRINHLTAEKSEAEALCKTLQETLSADKAELQTLASGNTEELDVFVRRIEIIEVLEQKQGKAKAEQDLAREAVHRLNPAASEERVKAAQARLAEIEAVLSNAQSQLQNDLEPYGVSPETAKTELCKRQERWVDKQTLATLATTLESQAGQIGDYEVQIQQQAQALEVSQASMDQLKTDRQTLFGDRHPDAVEEEMQSALDTARKANDATRTQLTECQQAKLRVQENIQTLEKQREETKQKLAELHTEDPLEITPENHAELAERCDELKEQSGQLKSQIDANEKAKALQEGKLAEIEKQQIECNRWNQLHELIGSADGKKFRNFAQGLTFELMVSHANQQLSKMSDRYLLVRDRASPLDLNVVDNYQAGEIRPVKNLSGGESFVVSLSLALGLSRMASKNIRVDSLFLDEGFGTLDEDALETALEALAELKQDGKLIGVISHVGALKERIGTQINVHVFSGGRSRLGGSGVSSEKE